MEKAAPTISTLKIAAPTVAAKKVVLRINSCAILSLIDYVNFIVLA
jgi:hypothetical protein